MERVLLRARIPVRGFDADGLRSPEQITHDASRKLTSASSRIADVVTGAGFAARPGRSLSWPRSSARRDHLHPYSPNHARDEGLR